MTKKLMSLFALMVMALVFAGGIKADPTSLCANFGAGTVTVGLPGTPVCVQFSSDPFWAGVYDLEGAPNFGGQDSLLQSYLEGPILYDDGQGTVYTCYVSDWTTSGGYWGYWANCVQFY